MRRDRRAERRVPVTRRAKLIQGAHSYPCLLQDFSGKGFFIISNRKFFVGQSLELKCELYPKEVLHCKVEVIHINETSIGTRITDIDADGTALLQQFLQEYYALKLNQSG
jgi:PilZ domain